MKITKHVPILVGLFLGLASVVFVLPTTHAASVVSDDFNAYTNGSVVSQGVWSSYVNGSNFLILGTDGMKALYNNAQADSVITKSGTPLSDGSQSVYIKTDNKTNWGTYADGNAQVRISKGGWGGSEARNFIATSFKKDGNVAYYDPIADTYKNFSAYNDNDWNLLEIEWRSSDKKAHYRINNGAWTDWFPFAGSGTFSNFDTVGLDFIAGGSGGVYIDNLSSASTLFQNYLLNPFDSSLKIDSITGNVTDRKNVHLFDFKLSDLAPSPYAGTQFSHGENEEIQIRRVRLSKQGTLSDSDISNIRLVNLDTGYVLQTVAAPNSSSIEFNLTIDSSKPDYGVMVSWHSYGVVFEAANSATGNIQTSIASANDISAYDYRNDSRVATITKLNSFPVSGLNLSLSVVPNLPSPTPTPSPSPIPSPSLSPNPAPSPTPPPSSTPTATSTPPSAPTPTPVPTPTPIPSNTNSNNNSDAQMTTSSGDLQTVIKQLQAQIQLLQAQIADLQAQVQSVKVELKLNRVLAKGASGDDVKQLQKFLKTFPDIYPEGFATGYFGSLTEAAVKKFQEKNGIESVGVVGPKTQVKLQELSNNK